MAVTDTGHYETIKRIRSEAGFSDNQQGITDQDIDSARAEAESMLNGALLNNYDLPIASPYPAILRLIVRRYAAGILLTREYGGMMSGSKDKGKDLIEEATSMIGKIAKKEIVVITEDGTSLERENSAVSGWPDDTTEGTDTSLGGDNGFMFKVTDVY